MTKTALLFPGQGSQSVGMLSELSNDFALVKETFAEASSVLGYDLWQLVQQGPEQQLNETQRTQPALLTASVALYRVAKEKGLADVTVMAGHSLGEYSALVCAGALEFTDAVKLVALRGEFMQQAVAEGEGAMAAVIGLEDAEIEKICLEQAGEQIVTPVNYNSPGQVVIAGHADAVARAAEALKEAGAKRVLPLPVSVPSHCALMQPAASQLADALKSIKLKQPHTPVINNVDVAIADSEDAIKDALVRQLYRPVRWTETIEQIAKLDVETAYEVGPGKVLTGLNKRITKAFGCSALNTLDSLNSL
ncbi:ACP S-malonyltransferase [Idiomarina loihiensis]|uniref:Malonyl CoA-acyl carrier protein transacylase n=1 Tax=Idiomarina loihiensis (strain ATCC BAA-735 / DSM 15497 / L2-TR) TaxID=283942 RepID=Q5QZ27_IDILO|nr:MULTISPECIES: ACP S-malonyltransferase [Idiomarina]AAV82181.1 Malonyl-CoA-[acyl-carrier-protein] transacylase [Idiomarina loihiensis L2TR]AGM36211.1 malonyl CoA-ACP transacylase [Idiomarina loihiensis GSL 199]MRJ43978.1 ACP S-malonyltransferase [Idiomarina loihiensis]UTW33893.1 ACP S-malonyltransferase [Idiomarina loihiensis]HAS23801.1 [acyl-carrier-protein] S-malonyltransferase [Idiomarina loihiensis]